MKRLFTTQEVLESWIKTCKVHDEVDQDAKDIVREALELKLLEEQGLLPKFHLGDEFWTSRLDKVLKAKIVMLQQKKDGSWRYRFSQEVNEKYHSTCDYEESDYGKYFFSDKEGAEKLLEYKQKKWKEEYIRLEEQRNKLAEIKESNS